MKDLIKKKKEAEKSQSDLSLLLKTASWQILKCLTIPHSLRPAFFFLSN